MDWKLANIVPVFKKEIKNKRKTTDLSRYFLLFLKSWRGAYSMLLGTMFSILSAHVSIAELSCVTQLGEVPKSAQSWIEEDKSI